MLYTFTRMCKCYENVGSDHAKYGGTLNDFVDRRGSFNTFLVCLGVLLLSTQSNN